MITFLGIVAYLILVGRSVGRTRDEYISAFRKANPATYVPETSWFRLRRYRSYVGLLQSQGRHLTVWRILSSKQSHEELERLRKAFWDRVTLLVVGAPVLMITVGLIEVLVWRALR